MAFFVCTRFIYTLLNAHMKKSSLAVYTSKKVDFPIAVMDLIFYSKCHLTAFC